VGNNQSENDRRKKSIEECYPKLVVFILVASLLKPWKGGHQILFSRSRSSPDQRENT
jgi:hypothetical protein